LSILSHAKAAIINQADPEQDRRPVVSLLVTRRHERIAET